MNTEQEFLSIITETLKNPDFIGDDCAYIKSMELVTTQDSLVENVHFKCSKMTPEEIGEKSTIALRLEPTKNGQNKGVRFFKDYEFEKYFT